MDKDISIYVPVYNGEKTIKACLDSILNQSLKPKKILVINDNSNDKTLVGVIIFGRIVSKTNKDETCRTMKHKEKTKRNNHRY